MTQVAYAEALKPSSVTEDLTKPLDAAGVTKLRGGIGAVLFL